MSPRFVRRGTKIVTRLPQEERDFLSQVLDLLAEVDKDKEDPGHRRLNVPVYLDDQESNEEWWRLMGGELEQARAHDRAIYRSVLRSERVTLSNEEADSFLRVINEGRLAFAARLGLEVEADHDTIPDPERSALDFMGWVLEELTVTLMDGL